MKIFWRKLYARSIEGEYNPAIINYYSAFDLLKIENGKTYVISKRKRLGLDLWLFTIRFDWKVRGLHEELIHPAS